MTKLITVATAVLALALAGCGKTPDSFDGIPPAQLARWQDEASAMMQRAIHDPRVAASPASQASVRGALAEFSALRELDRQLGTHEAESFFQEYSARIARISAASEAAEAKGKGI